ncbi:MAG: class I SAM-dependent methyltransferase [Gemmatimonadota bacterium]|nr:class I SAM-dependent methyltransferase [Gemmatimonadota bacterium]
MVAHYKEADYFEGGTCGYASYSAQERPLRLTFRRLLKNLDHRGVTGGTLLEVGCGYGYLLDEAAPYFARRLGTDMSERGVREAAGYADAVWLGGLEAVPPDIQADMVIAVHVIEHVYNPKFFVREMLRVLRPGGTLVLAAPDAGSLWFKLLRHRWPSFKFPEHVTFFDRRALAALLRRSGAENLRPIPYPHAFPLSVVAAKMRLRTPGFLADRSAWIPGTTVAMLGSAPARHS